MNEGSRRNNNIGTLGDRAISKQKPMEQPQLWVFALSNRIPLYNLPRNLGVTPSARPHECVRPELVVLVVDGRPGFEQYLHDPQPAPPAGDHQGRPPLDRSEDFRLPVANTRREGTVSKVIVDDTRSPTRWRCRTIHVKSSKHQQWACREQNHMFNECSLRMSVVLRPAVQPEKRSFRSCESHTYTCSELVDEQAKHHSNLLYFYGPVSRKP